jgi:hypothetical protein
VTVEYDGYRPVHDAIVLDAAQPDSYNDVIRKT